MVTFMLTQYADSHLSSCVFSIPIWLLCSCSRICFCNRQGIIMHLPFIAMLSVMASSCLISQYFYSCGSTTSSVYGHPLMVYICSLGSSSVPACMSSIHVHIGTFIDVLMLCILTFMLGVFWSWLLTWLWCDSQSTMYSSGPGLCRICMLSWCIHSVMHCCHFDNITTSLLIMATSDLWSVMTCTSFAAAVVVKVVKAM